MEDRQEKRLLRGVTIIAIVLALIGTIFSISLGIIAGFSWAILFIWLIFCIPILIQWLALFFALRWPFVTATVFLMTIMFFLLIASTKNNILGDSLYNWIDQHMHFDYFIGAITVFGIYIALVTIVNEEKKKKQ